MRRPVSRPILLYVLLVLLPAGVLSYLALAVADRDYEAGLRRLDEQLAEEGRALAARVRAALDDAAGRARRILDAAAERHAAGDGIPYDAPIGYLRGGEWIGYSPDVAAAETASDENHRRFALSLRGGESFEFELTDPERAIDAYGFYLPQLQPPSWRDRLRFRIARAAVAAGRLPLATAISRDLAASGGDAMTEEGLPIPLLAADLLRAHGLTQDGGDRIPNRDLVRRWAPRLSTPRLALFAERLAPEDEALASVLLARRRLEDAVSRAPAIGSTPAAVLLDDVLLLAREWPSEGGAPVSAVTLADVDLPALPSGDYQARLVNAPADPTPAASQQLSVALPVSLGEGGPALATLVIEDADRFLKTAALDRRLRITRLFVGLLVLVTLAGGAVLILYLERERRLVRLRADLLANVSHELKTPVTSIRMFSEMLAADPSDTDRTRRFGALMHGESLRLTHLIENILTFSRPRRKETPLAREPVDLREVTRRVAEGFAPRADQQGVAFRTEGIEDALGADGLVVISNADAIERILGNLLDNALKYRGPDKPEVVLRLEAHPGWVCLRVIDNGVGIPPREQDHVFEPFYRGRFRDYGVQGSGLGLSIARKLAHDLDGTLTLQSVENAGTTFTLELPIHPETPPPTPEEGSA